MIARRTLAKRTGSWGILCLLSLAAGIGVQVNQGQGAEPGPGDFVPYSLQTARAADLQEPLERILRGIDPHAEVILDGRHNRLLIAGPPAVHTAASQYLAAMDLQAAARSGNGPRRATGSPDTGRSGGVQPAQHEARQTAAATGPVTLHHLTVEQLEATLRDYLRGDLDSQVSADRQSVTFWVPAAGEQQVELTVHLATRQVQARGPSAGVQAWMEVVRALDRPPASTADITLLLPLDQADRPALERVFKVLRTSVTAPSTGTSSPEAKSLLRLPALAPPARALAAAQPPAAPAQAAPDAAQPPASQPAPADQPPPADEAVGGVVGNVRIEFLGDTIILQGHERDVQRLAQLIREIEQLSADTIPEVEIVPLMHTNSEALSALVNQLFESVYASRQGHVTITALVKPNALLLVGSRESIDVVIDLIRRLDVPVDPATQFRVFPLQHVGAATAERTLREFFGDQAAGDQDEEAQGGLGARVRITADVRSNVLIVRASPRDLAEVERLLSNLDVETSQLVNHVEVFQLRNSRAEELAPILQRAISGQTEEGATGGPQPLPGQLGGTVPVGPPSGATSELQGRSAMLTFSVIGPDGQEQLLRSGIMSDVQIAADPTTNSLIVTAPDQAMGLIAALIERLDQLPSAEAVIKVFTMENGDASAMRDLLEELFPPPLDQPGLQGPAFQPSGAGSSLVPVRFAVDQRTNSIIATGTPADLTVVRAIILNLDGSDVRERRNVVHRLRYANATLVAASIQEFLRSEQLRTEQQIRALTQNPQGAVGPFEQIEREVVVVAEALTNSLIISSTPRFFDQIMEIIQDLDALPPMVMIQVLIAEVELDNQAQFGTELGIQDSLLFDRGNLLGEPLDMATVTVGENFAGQSRTNLALGTFDPTLGYGGLVLAAGNESLSFLLRALQQRHQLRILSRPQIMTLDNQAARIQVGADVRVPSGTSVTQFGQTNLQTERVSIGLILDVVPRVSPDGTVFMFLRAEKSALGPESNGTAIAITDDGNVVRSPRINITLAETSVSVPDGQTAVFSGLLTKEDEVVSRGVPWLSDVPLVGNLFRFDAIVQRRTELLIILTPHVIRSPDDLARVSQMEASRMNWCLADVVSLHGDPSLVNPQQVWIDNQIPTIYPDGPPVEILPGEPLPADEPGPAFPGLQPAPLPLDESR